MRLRARLSSVLVDVERGQAHDPALAEGLGVYAHSRDARLLDVMGDDFPRVRAWLGHPSFEGTVRAYLEACPPMSPRMSDLGRRFPRWLEAVGARPLAVELARLEWGWNEVFFAPQAPVVGREALAEHPPERWPRLRFSIAPHRIEAFSHRVDRFSMSAPELGAREEPVTLLVFRKDMKVRLRSLEPDEVDGLQAALEGASLEAVAEAVARHRSGVEEASHRVLGLLTQWLDDELVERVDS